MAGHRGRSAKPRVRRGRPSVRPRRGARVRVGRRKRFKFRNPFEPRKGRK